MSPSLEALLVYRVSDLPPVLAARLPEGSGPRGCLFWIAPSESQALDALMDGLEEPELDHTEEGMELAQVVGELAARSRLLAELLRPGEVPPLGALHSGIYQLGFHTADADEALAFLQATGARLLPIDAIFDHLAIASVKDHRGELPGTTLHERWVREDSMGFRILEPAEDGLFALEPPEEPYLAYALFGLQQGIELPPPRGGDLLSLTLQAEPPPPAAEGASSALVPALADADLATAIAIVNEVNASALAIATPQGPARLSFRVSPCEAVGIDATGTLELTVDGALRKVGAGPVALAPRVASQGRRLDPERLRNLARGVRRAAAQVGDLEALMPEDFLPVDLLLDEALTTEEDFAANAFALAPIARARAPREVPGFLARHGAPQVDATVMADLWCLLPGTVLDRRWSAPQMVAAREATERLAATPAGRPLLALAADAWVERALDDRAWAVAYVPSFDSLLAAIGGAVGFEVVRAATRRAVARWRGGPS